MDSYICGQFESQWWRDRLSIPGMGEIGYAFAKQMNPELYKKLAHTIKPQTRKKNMQERKICDIELGIFLLDMTLIIQSMKENIGNLNFIKNRTYCLYKDTVDDNSSHKMEHNLVNHVSDKGPVSRDTKIPRTLKNCSKNGQKIWNSTSSKKCGMDKSPWKNIINN